MPRAVLKDGTIQPLEPLPAEWRDGQELRVESTSDCDEVVAGSIDADFHDLAVLCQAGDPLDDERLKRALDESKRQAKEQVRRQMGLPE
jgi:hypothetical protein